jgi:N-acetylglucosaminyldiphosphoundecaprenol N-acetyl-beta-D-mannosaminyltransferase
MRAMEHTVYLNGIPVNLYSNDAIFRLTDDWLVRRQGSRHIITLNAAMMVAALKDNLLKEIINRADLVTVDGYGIDWALQKKGFHNIQRLTGIDLARELLKKSCQNAYSVYFFGSSPKVAATLRKVLPVQWPGLIICNIHDGYGGSLPPAAVFKEIVIKQPRLLLVGLGTPEQELFLAKILPYLDATVGIGVGGALEVLSGLKREAPQFIRKHGLEWCYRMLQAPRKLRLIPDLAKFWFRYLR